MGLMDRFAPIDGKPTDGKPSFNLDDLIAGQEADRPCEPVTPSVESVEPAKGEPAKVEPSPAVEPVSPLLLIRLDLPAPAPLDKHPDDPDEVHAELVRSESSAVARLLTATGGDGGDWLRTTQDKRGRTDCPACGTADSFSLEVARSYEPQQVEARCDRGCSSKVLATAIQKVIVNYEEAEASRAIAAEMDPTRAAGEPLRWAVPLLAPAAGLTLLRGRSGSGKSWIVTYAAVCKALGAPFFGRAVERGRVALIFLESREINQARIALIVRGLGRTMDELSDWLDVWPEGQPLKSDDRASRADLARRVRARKYTAIFVDNTTRLRTSRSQNSENDSAILSAVLEPLADLAQTGMMDGQCVVPAKFRPAIVVLDHDRGSSAAEQNADYVVTVARSSPDPEATVTLDLAEGCRVQHEDLPIRVRFVGKAPSPVAARVVDAPGEPSTPELVEDRLTAIVDAVRASPGAGINAISRATERTNKRDLGRDLDALVEAGRLTVDGEKKYRPAE